MVSGDGTLRSALVLESEEDFEESELKEFLEGQSAVLMRKGEETGRRPCNPCVLHSRSRQL